MTNCSTVDLSKTLLAGVAEATLRTWLSQAQQAMADLMTGSKPITVTYTQGDGQKSVTYHKTDMMNLTMWINQIQIQLGISKGRGPLRPYFNGR